MATLQSTALASPVSQHSLLKQPRSLRNTILGCSPEPEFAIQWAIFTVESQHKPTFFFFSILSVGSSKVNLQGCKQANSYSAKENGLKARPRFGENVGRHMCICWFQLFVHPTPSSSDRDALFVFFLRVNEIK
ncbi:hypothetical protein CRYUN_Cryun23aG0069800 [Craigia yunnanensis]